jgi:hypothetical protein
MQVGRAPCRQRHTLEGMRMESMIRTKVQCIVCDRLSRSCLAGRLQHCGGGQGDCCQPRIICACCYTMGIQPSWPWLPCIVSTFQ